jgi:hypothetical protein
MIKYIYRGKFNESRSGKQRGFEKPPSQMVFLFKNFTSFTLCLECGGVDNASPQVWGKTW